MKAKQFTLFVLSMAIGLAGLLGGCRPFTPPPDVTSILSATPEAPIPTVTPPIETATPTAVPTATPSFKRVSIPEVGLTLAVPAYWQRQGQEWIWTPVDSDEQRLGVAWHDITPGQEPESLFLPQGSVMLDRTPGPELSWGTAATYRLHVMLPGGHGQIEAVEVHVIVRSTQKLYDFYVGASNEEQLAPLEPVLQHMLTSLTLAEARRVNQDRNMATKQFISADGWSFDYPASWDKVEPTGYGIYYVQETATGKTVEFRSQPTSKSELESWIESEIARKLEVAEAENTLVEPLVVSQKEALTVYRYTIRCRRCESCDTLLKTTVFFDGTFRYEFYTAIPPATEEEYEAILDSFRLGDR